KGRLRVGRCVVVVLGRAGSKACEREVDQPAQVRSTLDDVRRAVPLLAVDRLPPDVFLRQETALLVALVGMGLLVAQPVAGRKEQRRWTLIVQQCAQFGFRSRPDVGAVAVTMPQPRAEAKFWS